jgi:hypothetical protein
MRNRWWLGFCSALFLLPSPAWPQFWEKKDYSKWSQGECIRMLNDSPWARQYSVSTVEIRPLQSASTDDAREARPEIAYTGQLRSALPVRQALVRLGQFSAKYDERSAEERAQIDRQAAEFLDREFEDSIVVYVSASSNVTSYYREMVSYWQARGQIELSTMAYLITQSGKKIAPQRVQITENGGLGLQLIFPRQLDGKAVLDPANKKGISIEFQHPNIGGLGAARVLLEFKPNKMLYRGSLEY